MSELPNESPVGSAAEKTPAKADDRPVVIHGPDGEQSMYQVGAGVEG